MIMHSRFSEGNKFLMRYFFWGMLANQSED